MVSELARENGCPRGRPRCPLTRCKAMRHGTHSHWRPRTPTIAPRATCRMDNQRQLGDEPHDAQPRFRVEAKGSTGVELLPVARAVMGRGCSLQAKVTAPPAARPPSVVPPVVDGGRRGSSLGAMSDETDAALARHDLIEFLGDLRDLFDVLLLERPEWFGFSHASLLEAWTADVRPGVEAVRLELERTIPSPSLLDPIEIDDRLRARGLTGMQLRLKLDQFRAAAGASDEIVSADEAERYWRTWLARLRIAPGALDQLVA